MYEEIKQKEKGQIHPKAGGREGYDASRHSFSYSS